MKESSKPVEIAVLSDNTTKDPHFGSEWGFSACVKSSDNSLFLWDFGKTDLFRTTGGKLGLDFTKITGAGLSHGHHDHVGGLAVLIDDLGYAGPIHAHPGCLDEHWKVMDHVAPRMIGVSPELRIRLEKQLNPVTKATEVAPGVVMLTDIPRRPGFGQSIAHFYYDTAGKRIDPVPDDGFLCLDTPSGWVALLGCCHAGLANSLYYARDTLGINAFHTVLGGLHLLKADDHRLKEAGDVLDEFKVEHIRAGHCTDKAAAAYLAERFPRRAGPLGTGEVLKFNNKKFSEMDSQAEPTDVSSDFSESSF